LILFFCIAPQEWKIDQEWPSKGPGSADTSLRCVQCSSCRVWLYSALGVDGVHIYLGGCTKGLSAQYGMLLQCQQRLNMIPYHVVTLGGALSSVYAVILGTLCDQTGRLFQSVLFSVLASLQ
jgi:hypothetical protein